MMARINQDLLGRLAETLGITRKAVYPHIQKVVAESGLENDLAALFLARQHGINISRYSTPQQRDAIRGVRLNPVFNDAAPQTPAIGSPGRTRGRKSGPAKKAKDNSVFVVHGRDEGLRRSCARAQPDGVEPCCRKSEGRQPLCWADPNVSNGEGASCDCAVLAGRACTVKRALLQ